MLNYHYAIAEGVAKEFKLREFSVDSEGVKVEIFAPIRKIVSGILLI